MERPRFKPCLLYWRCFLYWRREMSSHIFLERLVLIRQSTPTHTATRDLVLTTAARNGAPLLRAFFPCLQLRNQRT